MPSSFMTPLRTEFDYEGNPKKPFIIIEPFVYHIDHLGGEQRVVVPIGFRTDFASIPKPFRNIFSPTGPYGKIAVVHDWLYNHGYITQWGGDPETLTEYEIHLNVTRKKADDILLEGMEVLGVGRFTRYSVYWAVRIGGSGDTWSDDGKKRS